MLMMIIHIIKSLDDQKIYPRLCVCAYIELHHFDQNIKNIWSFGMSNYEMKYMALLVTPTACTLVIQGIPMQIEIYKLKIMTYLSYNYKLIHVIS